MYENTLKTYPQHYSKYSPVSQPTGLQTIQVLMTIIPYLWHVPQENWERVNFTCSLEKSNGTKFITVPTADELLFCYFELSP